MDKSKHLRLIAALIVFVITIGISNQTIAQAIHITQNTTWSTSNPPPPITGSIIVENGIILKIKSGLTLTFPIGTGLHIRANAKLDANGVEFTSLSSWNGITMEGLGSNVSQYSYNTPKQPYALIRNCIISNAVIGIQNSNNNYVNSGGRFILNETTFYNCQVGVRFWPFVFTKPNGNIENERSVITKCHFYNKLPSAVGIYLHGVNNVRINGNVFKNTFLNSTNTNHFTGIKAVLSSIIVKDYEDLLHPSNNVSNSFEDCEYGIYIIDTKNITRKQIIKNCKFTSTADHCTFQRFSIKGISCDNLEIYSNDISLSRNADPYPYEQFGVYLDNCTGFHIEGNSIYTTLGKGSQDNTIGIEVRNSGGQSNELYRNTFTDCQYMIHAVDKNRGLNSPYGNNDKGLRFFCNSFDDAASQGWYFMTSAASIVAPLQGVARMQGGSIVGSPSSPAYNNIGSRTLPVGSENDFKNHYNTGQPTSNDIIYLQPYISTGQPNNYDLVYYSQSVFPVTTGVVQTCPSKIPSSNPIIIDDIRAEMVSLKAQLVPIKQAFNSYVNNGDHAFMLNVANNITPSSYISAYGYLMNNHPSYDVLAIAVGDDDLPPYMVRDILVTNSYGIKDSDVKSALASRAYPLNSSQMNDIDTAAQSISQYENYLFELAYLDNQYRQNYNIAVDYYSNLVDDEVVDVKDLLVLFTDDHDFISTAKLSMYYYEHYDFNNANIQRARLQNLSQEQEELDDIDILLSIVEVVYTHFNGDYSQLNTQQRDDIDKIATHNTVAAGIAMGINVANFNKYPEVIWVPVTSSSPRIGHFEDNNDENIEQIIRTYPNPANNLLNIDLGNIEGNAMFEMFDINGRIVMSLNIDNTISSIKTSELPSGMYFIKISQNDETIYSTKVNIIH